MQKKIDEANGSDAPVWKTQIQTLETNKILWYANFSFCQLVLVCMVVGAQISGGRHCFANRYSPTTHFVKAFRFSIPRFSFWSISQ